VIDDGTGTLDVKQWVDTDVAPDGSAQELNGKHVRVLGQLKSFSNKKHVGSHKIYAVTDFNEVQFHLLEATAIHLHLIRGPPEQFAPTAGDSKAVVAYGHNKDKGAVDVVMGGTGDDAGRSLPSQASQNARLIYSLLKNNSPSAEGMNVNTIRMRTQLSSDDISRAMYELTDLAAVYTTIDDSTFAPLDV
jgi:replication factor A2